MRKRSWKSWLLGLASASLLSSPALAQSPFGAVPSANERTIILVDGAAPAAAAPAPAAAAPVIVESNGGGDAGGSADSGGLKISGFIYGTGIYNTRNSGRTRYNGPLTMNEQEGAFLNQLYISIEKAMGDDFGIGGRADAFYGNDYNASQSRGWELRSSRLVNAAAQKWNDGQDYGFAVPQLYGEIGTSKASLVIGHFWTPIGFGVVPATGNFFNTQPFGFMAGNPFTHWGAMAKFAPSEQLTAYVGVVNGWDSLDRPENSAGYIFGGKYTSSCKKWWAAANFSIGDEPENLGNGYDNRYLHNLIFGADLNDNVQVVFEHNYGVQQNRALGNSTYYSFAPYLFYKLSDCMKAGVRYEYFRDPGGFVAGIRNGNPNVGAYTGNFQTIAAGLNWNPNGSKNLTIRPELRYDWFSGAGNPFNAGASDNQFLLVLGGVLTF